MDDEDGRCLLDVICDPQALNDFLHGSNKVTAAASAGVGSQVTPSAACVEISFLDDDVLGSPVEEEPCDILQQSLQEANITLQEEADVAASMLLQSHPQSLPHTQSQPQLQCHPQAHTQPRPQLHPQSCPQTQPCPNSQPRPQPCPLSQSHPYPGKLLAEPASDAASDSQPTFASALVPCPVPSDPVSTRFLGKRLGVQCLIQRASLKTVAASVQAAYNGSPRGSSLSQTQMVDQYIGQTAMISVGPNHHHPITKASLPTNLPPESYPPTSPSEDQVTPSSSVSPFPKDTGLHGTSLFTNAGLSQSAQLVTGRAVVRTPGSSQNVIKHRTPPQIQPKHCVSIQPKVVQISPKASFGPNPQTLEAAIKIQTEAVLQQQKSPPNSTFVAGVSGQNIFLPAQGHSLAQTVARSLSKQQAQPDLGKSMSVHVLKPGSIVIQPPSIPQPVVPGHSQFILPGRLAGTSAVTLPQRPPAVPAEALLTAQSSAAQGQLATSGVLGLRGPSGQLGSRQSLPAHILSTQNLAGHLTSFGRVVAAANTQLAVSHGRARIVSGPLQLPPGQLAPSTQLPVPTQLGAGSAHTYPPGPRATTMVQGISLPNRITVLNHTGPVGQAMNLQQLSTLSSKGSVVQTSTDAELTPALALLQTHTSPQCHPHTPPQSQSHLLDTQHPPPPSVTTPLTVTSITVAENINQQDRRSVLNANQLLLFQQKEQKQQLLYQQALRLQQKKGLSLTSSTSLSLPVTAESVLASGGSGAAAQAKASLVSASTVRMAPNKPTVLPQAQSNHFLPALASQASPGMITDLTGLNVALSKGPVQFQMFGRGIACLTSTANIQSALFEEPIGSLKQSVGATLNRADLLLERFCKDQTSVLQPDCNTPFYSFEDTVFRLLPYHVCKGTMPSDVDFNKVDEEFEVMSTKLLKRTQAMLNKYRMLLFEESRRTKPSAEMVMIDRMFIQEEKVAFLEAKQLARESPDAYISSVFQPNITNSSPTPSCLLVAPNELIQNASQISGTNLVMEQARGWPSDTCATASKAGEAEEVAVSSQPSPPKANTASARGELKLKIKQEAGYSKVIHNTALDQLPVDPVTQSSGTKGSSASPFSHSNRVPSPAEKRLLEHLDSRDPSEPRDHLMNCDRQNPHCCSPKLVHGLSRRSLPQDNAVSELEADEKTGLTSFPLNNGAYHLKSNSSIAGSALQNLKQDTVEGQPGENSDDSNLMKELEEVEDAIRQGLTKASYVHDLHWELPLPQPKRHKSDSVDNASFSSDSPQDSTLNQHLQSAINSILDLQRVQMSEEEQSMAEPSEARELSSPLFSPVASSGDYRQPEQDRDFVRAGTSTLEEAVNSILSD